MNFARTRVQFVPKQPAIKFRVEKRGSLCNLQSNCAHQGFAAGEDVAVPAGALLFQIITNTAVRFDQGIVTEPFPVFAVQNDVSGRIR